MTPSQDSADPASKPEIAGGFSVLDGAALVLGSTMASVHLRHLVEQRDLSAFGWGLVWITFAGIALTATGPFLFLVRRFLRRVPGYPSVGDYLWAFLGVPWLLAALLRQTGGTWLIRGVESILGNFDAATGAYTAALWLAQTVACLIVLVVIWRSWVLVSPEELKAREPVSWTDRVGLVLAIAWPLQCGFSLVAVG